MSDKNNTARLIAAIVTPPIILFVLLTLLASAFIGAGATFAMVFIAGFAIINLVAMVVIGLPVHFMLKKHGASERANYSFFGCIGGAAIGALVASLGIPIGNGTAAADSGTYFVGIMLGAFWGLVSALIARHIALRRVPEKDA